MAPAISTEHRLSASLADVAATYASLSPAVIDEELRRLELQSRETEARKALLMSVAGSRGVADVDGHRGVKQWMKATTNCPGVEAFRWRRRSRAADELPGVAEAWLAGRIGRDQVDVLAKAHANPRCGHELRDWMPVMLRHAEQLEFDDFAMVVKRWETLADSEGAFDESRDAHARRRATIIASELGLDLVADGGDPLTAVEMKEIFERAVEAEYQADVATRDDRWADDAEHHALARTSEQRRFDALVKIFRSYVTAPADGKRPEPVVHVVFDARNLGDELHAHGLTCANPFGLVEHPDVDDALAAHCETTTGIVIDPHLALHAAVTGHVRRVVIDSKSVVIDHGERRRLFTGSARTAATLLATQCAHRGCDVPVRRCQVDHITGFAEGGLTIQSNAAVLCGYHNRVKHRKRWGLRRSADGRIHTIRPDGTDIRAAGQRPPTWPESA